MIEGTAAKEGIPIKRPDVYICNVVKCRPPENRTPQPDEMEICGQFLYRQLQAIRPKAICAARIHCGQGSARHQGRRHATARKMAHLARHSGDGHLPSVVPVAALQSKREEGSVGGSEEGPALCLRLAAASSSPLKGRTAAAKARRLVCSPSACAAKGGTVLETVEPGGTPIGQQIRRILLDPANKELTAALPSCC